MKKPKIIKSQKVYFMSDEIEIKLNELIMKELKDYGPESPATLPVILTDKIINLLDGQDCNKDIIIPDSMLSTPIKFNDLT